MVRYTRSGGAPAAKTLLLRRHWGSCGVSEEPFRVWCSEAAVLYRRTDRSGGRSV